MTVRIEATGETFRDIWELIEANPAEALNLRMRSDLMRALAKRVGEWGVTQKAAAARLGITQPRLNLLVNGRINEFSLDALVALLRPAGLEIEVSVRAA